MGEETNDLGSQAPTKLTIAFYTLIGSLIGSALTFIAAVVTSILGFWNDNRELDLKMVDVALAILAGEKGGTTENQPPEARRFAINALRNNSNVAMDEIHWNAWIESNAPLNIDRYQGLARSDSDKNFGRPASVEGVYKLWFEDTETNCTIRFSVASVVAIPAIQLQNCDETTLSDAKRWTKDGDGAVVYDSNLKVLAKIAAEPKIGDGYIGVIESTGEAFWLREP
ncbi:MAG: hypothetical protein K5905_17285 [Roseibium sp.]|uniref:hypothetical protein n=1 Tax=Roseibium sp. TaxID=1936156 RepID=UPI00263150AD|nr:hypothetical protein [Roseibium sp.]MCV0427218.1 hypothetical protein [Roseibium sp.]